MTGLWISGAFLAAAAFGWRMAALTCALVAAVLLVRRQRSHLLAALLVSTAALVGAARGVPPPDVATPAWTDLATALKGRVDSAPTTSGRFQSFRLAVAEVEIDGRWQAARGSVCVGAPPLPQAGLADQVLVLGKPEPLSDQAAALRGYLHTRGCGASVFATSLTIVAPGAGWRRGFADLRRSMSGILRRSALGDSGALLSGLVTGDDHRLTNQRQDAFLRTGTTHITAVSGANLALVVTILATLGRAGGVRRRLVWQLVVIGAIAAYAVLVGLESPVLRAGLAAAGAVLAVRFGRRPDMLTLIAVAAAVMVLVEPAQIWTLSFQLSVTASLGIVLAMSGLDGSSWHSGVTAILAGTLAAQLATLPVLWVVFGKVSLASVPANLLIAPLIALAFPVAALAALLGLVWGPLATVAVLPARLCVDLVFGVVDRLASPGPMVVTVGAASPGVVMLVSALTATAVLALSPDVRLRVGRLLAALERGPSAADAGDRRESISPIDERSEDEPMARPAVEVRRDR